MVLEIDTWWEGKRRSEVREDVLPYTCLVTRPHLHVLHEGEALVVARDVVVDEGARHLDGQRPPRPPAAAPGRQRGGQPQHVPLGGLEAAHHTQRGTGGLEGWERGYRGVQACVGLQVDTLR